MDFRLDIGVASRIMKMSRISLQCALKQKALPIGGAWRNEGSTCYTYYISSHKFCEFLGITKEELERMMKDEEVQCL